MSDEKLEFPLRGIPPEQQFVPSLTGESFEILDRARIGRQDSHDLPALQFGERLLEPQHRQWAVETARIHFLVELHRFLRFFSIVSKPLNKSSFP
jgi:hypothetical protein